MKTNKIFLAGLMAISLFSCSDVEIPEPEAVATVSNLTTSVNNRSVTLSWTPAGGDVVKYIVLHNGTQIAEVEAGVNTYTIKRVKAEVEQAFTVKAVFADGTTSPGITTFVTVPYTRLKSAYLVLDGELDDDEQASHDWFKANFVDNGNGEFITLSELDRLNSIVFGCLMIHIDRVGLANGVENLPSEVGTERVLGALREYVKDGGNLLLNNHACQLVHGIGRIPMNCQTAGIGSGDGGEGGDNWSACPYIGYQDFGNPEGNCYDHTGHAIYRGLSLDPDLVTKWNFPPGFSLIGPGHREDHNCIYDVNAMGYEGGVNNIKNFEDDQLCACLATWSHVRDWCVSGITEFYPKGDYQGRIIAIGLAAYEWNQNSGPNPYQANIEAIAKNSLDYLSE